MTAACFMLCSKETEGLVVGEKRTITNGIASAGAESCPESGKWDCICPIQLLFPRMVISSGNWVVISLQPMLCYTVIITQLRKCTRS